MSSIMGQIIAFTFSVLNLPLPWDNYNWTLLEVIFVRIELFLVCIFIWRVLMFYARKYDL